MTVDKITNHEDLALDRLITQYKNKTNIEGVIKSFSTQIQELENVLFQVLDDTWVSTSTGQQLDNLGVLLNQSRGSLDDDDYRALLLITISKYNSETTIEDIISIFNVLTNSDSISLGEIFPAEISLNSLNPDPLVTDASFITNAILQAKAAGIKISSISYSLTGYFGFDGDTNACGFGNTTDTSLCSDDDQFSLLESGDFILLESGYKLILEKSGGIWTSLNLPETPSFCLLESGDNLLLETGYKLIL